jgi:hypothetical protein
MSLSKGKRRKSSWLGEVFEEVGIKGLWGKHAAKLDRLTGGEPICDHSSVKILYADSPINVGTAIEWWTIKKRTSEQNTLPSISNRIVDGSVVKELAVASIMAGRKSFKRIRRSAGLSSSTCLARSRTEVS